MTKIICHAWLVISPLLGIGFFYSKYLMDKDGFYLFCLILHYPECVCIYMRVRAHTHLYIYIYIIFYFIYTYLIYNLFFFTYLFITYQNTSFLSFLALMQLPIYGCPTRIQTQRICLTQSQLIWNPLNPSNMVVDDRFVSRTLYIGWLSGGFLCMQLDWTNLTKNLAILLLLPSSWAYLLHFCHPIFANLLRSPLDLVKISTDLHEFHCVMTTMTHTMLEATLTNLTSGIPKLWQLIFTELMINGRSRSSAPKVVRLSDKWTSNSI